MHSLLSSAAAAPSGCVFSSTTASGPTPRSSSPPHRESAPHGASERPPARGRMSWTAPTNHCHSSWHARTRTPTPCPSPPPRHHPPPTPHTPLHPPSQPSPPLLRTTSPSDNTSDTPRGDPSACE